MWHLIERRSRQTVAIGAVLVVAITLVLVSLSPSSNPQQNGFDRDGRLASNEKVTVASGDVAPLDFVLKRLDGSDVHLASYKGRIIVLNFWATWCLPCRAEIPGLVAVQATYRNDLIVLGLLVQDRITDRTQPFAKSLKINYPVLDANDRDDLENAFGPFWGIPASVIIGRDGRIAKKHLGFVSKEQFERDVKGLI